MPDVAVAAAADIDSLVDYNSPAARNLDRSLDYIVDSLVAGIERSLGLVAVRYGTVVGIDSVGMVVLVEKSVLKAERTVHLAGRILLAEYTVCLDHSAGLYGGSVESCVSFLHPEPLGRPPMNRAQTW